LYGNTHTHTHWTDCSTWTTEVNGNQVTTTRVLMSFSDESNFAADIKIMPIIS